MEEIWFWYIVALITNIMAVFYVWPYSAALSTAQKVILTIIAISIIILPVINFIAFIILVPATILESKRLPNIVKTMFEN